MSNTKLKPLYLMDIFRELTDEEHRLTVPELVEELQREFRVTLAGPTTMAALLNSLQMGFRTLAIQKRSGEVWKVLGAVRTEFDKFGDVLEAAQKRLEQASGELDKLVGVRTRVIRSKLKNVTELSEKETRQYLGDGRDAE